MKSHEEELEEILALENDTREAMLSMLEDIVEQKEMIERSHKEWMDAFDTIEDGVMLHDKEYNLMRVNRAYLELSGVEKFKYIIGKPYFEVFPKLDAPMESCSKSIETHEMSEEELRLEDGRIFRSRTYPIYDKEDQYNYGIHIFEDITKEYQQELRLEELNKTLRLISRCNEILVRSVTEEDLVNDVCGEIIKEDSYDFVGVFYKQKDKIKCLHYLEKVPSLKKLSDADFLDKQYKDCPVTECIEKNEIINIEDIAHDEKWSEILRKSEEICPASPYNMQGSMLLLPLANTEMLGALVLYSRSVYNFNKDKVALFLELSEDTAYGIHTLRLRKKHEIVTQERDNNFRLLKESLEGTVESIAKMVEARDPYTAGHQNRVAALAIAIAGEMGLEENTIEGLRIAGKVHDIGKIQIPSEILSKPTKLTDLEFALVQTHAQTGYDILKNIHFPWPVADMVHQHHERIDGSGYPNGLKDNEILLEAKILSVADVIEAIASHRPYRASLGIDFALAEIQKGAGKIFDLKVVEACLKIFSEGYELPNS